MKKKKLASLQLHADSLQCVLEFKFYYVVFGMYYKWTEFFYFQEKTGQHKSRMNKDIFCLHRFFL